MNKSRNVQRHDRTKAKRGKQSKAAKHRRERRAACGHGCKQQTLMSKADKHLAEIEARLAVLLEPQVFEYALSTRWTERYEPKPDYMALSKEARRQRIRDILDSGYQKAVEREAIVLGKDHYSVQ